MNEPPKVQTASFPILRCFVCFYDIRSEVVNVVVNASDGDEDNNNHRDGFMILRQAKLIDDEVHSRVVAVEAA